MAELLSCPGCSMIPVSEYDLVFHCLHFHNIPFWLGIYTHCPCGWVEDTDGPHNAYDNYAAHCRERGGVLEHLREVFVLRALQTGGGA